MTPSTGAVMDDLPIPETRRFVVCTLGGQVWAWFAKAQGEYGQRSLVLEKVCAPKPLQLYLF